MAFNFFNYIIVMLIAGAGGFGGGMGGANIIKEFAINWGGITDGQAVEEFFRVISISQYNGYSQGMMLANYVGNKTELGIIGGIIGVAAYLIPSLAFLIIILKIGEKLYKNSVFQYSLKYINLLAAGLICMMLWNYLITVFENDMIVYMATAALACYLNIYFNINPVLIVLGGAAIGALWRA